MIRPDQLTPQKLGLLLPRPFANLAVWYATAGLEIVIVAALIYLGWNRPFKEWAAQGTAMATS